MSSKAIGIEIGTKNTKILYGKLKNNRFEVIKSGILENTDKVFNVEGDIIANQLEPLLREKLKEMKIKRGNLYLTISSNKTIVRNREFPAVKLKELDEIVRYETEQFLPYDADSFFIDYKVLSRVQTDESDLVKVMIAAIPKEIVNDYLEVFKRMKFHLSRVNISTNSICELFSGSGVGKEENVMVVDVGHRFLRLNLFQDCSYYAHIVSEVGVQDVVNGYSRFMKTTPSKAHDYLFGKEVPKVDPGAIQMHDVQKEFGSLKFNVDGANDTDGANDADGSNSPYGMKSAVNDAANDALREIESMLNGEKDTEVTADEEQTEVLHQSYAEGGSSIPVSDNYVYLPDMVKHYGSIYQEIDKMMTFYKSRRFGLKIDKIYLIGGGANLVGLTAYVQERTEIETLPIDDALTIENLVEDQSLTLLSSALGSLYRGKSYAKN